MSRTVVALLGGAAGLVGIIILLLLWFYISHKRSASRNSKNGSSNRSQENTRRFDMEELSLATKNFSRENLIGEGKFGEVYQGLLQDGTLVAIKKRCRLPSQDFVDEVRYLSSIHHQNLVAVLGYCQENNLQFLVYEYVPNGSVSGHLYGPSQQLNEKLGFKHRCSISLGAAKGLAHLHSLRPSLVHTDFKTANVLLDENYFAKVADAGVHNFLGRNEITGPSSLVDSEEIFLAPEVREFRQFSDKSDVYSFGVFLLQLLIGKAEAKSLSLSSINQNLVELVMSNQDNGNMSNIIDPRMLSSFTTEGMEDFILLIVRCLNPSSEIRPTMNDVVMELDRIFKIEMKSISFNDEGSLNVTLGSELFLGSE